MGGFGYGGYGGGLYGNEAIITLGVGYYLQLVTSQYQQASPQYLQFLQVMLQKYQDIDQCLLTFEKNFDIDYAVGAQLDILGSNRGVPRTVPFQPSNGVSPVLDDTTYRILLKATDAANRWKPGGSIGSLYAIWQQLFPGGSITIDDQQNMTAIITLAGSFSSIIKDLIINGLIVPRPETVQYTFVFGTLPIFGFDQRNAFVSGFDLGHFA